jgi:hypothetical protein
MSSPFPLSGAHAPLDHLALRGADDAPALVLRSGVLSYQDLRSRVAVLAGWLRAVLGEEAFAGSMVPALPHGRPREN